MSMGPFSQTTDFRTDNELWIYIETKLTKM